MTAYWADSTALQTLKTMHKLVLMHGRAVQYEENSRGSVVYMIFL